MYAGYHIQIIDKVAREIKDEFFIIFFTKLNWFKWVL